VKLLLDQNLSYKLVAAIDDMFPGSAHVRDVGLAEATTPSGTTPATTAS
jgi:predicted nuclease of predicted toxin-antitoxin system